MPRFALLEGTLDDFINGQENKNTRAKTDMQRYNFAKYFSKRRASPGMLKK